MTLYSATPLLDYYEGRSMVIVGGSGLSGTALIYKLVTCTKVSHIYVVVRGGDERLWKLWTADLPETVISTLRTSNRIIPIAGDATSPGNLGVICPDILTTLRNTVSIIINLASKIRLLAPLSEVKQTNIDSALNVADFALQFPKLERFVWASSAYANSHLSTEHDQPTTIIGEGIYPNDILYSPGMAPLEELNSLQLQQTEEEYSALSETGSTPIYLSGKHLTSYTYAKHLTERLLLSRYKPKLPNLMIFRPSAIGPALQEPFPRYERLGSTPVTTILSFTISAPNQTIEFPSRGGFSGLVDEIPVDICMNQLLAHVSSGTTGIVHAVAGAENCLTLGDYWREYLCSVPFSERPSIKWVDDTILRTPESQSQLLLNPVLRLFCYLGASFDFAKGKTEKVWGKMGEKEREILPLKVAGREELEWALKLRKKRTGAAITAEFVRMDNKFFADTASREVHEANSVEGLTWTHPEGKDYGFI